MIRPFAGVIAALVVTAITLGSAQQKPAPVTMRRSEVGRGTQPGLVVVRP